ncbi:MAG: hypothetical protein HYY38_06835 [Rhodospirillales bacterium]|nr:hypothetical protein [Rhodospirillales bacterium]
MSERDSGDAANAHELFLQLLEQSGFFQQIQSLETNLKTVAGELQAFGGNAARRMEETENLAAHVLAIESILAVMLKAYPILADDLKAEVKDRTAALSGNSEGSPTVLALAADILAKATA